MSGAKKVFSNSEHIRCYFHTVKAVKDKINRWKNSTEKKLIQNEFGLINYAMKLLHCATTDDDFVNLWKLIKDEWNSKYPENFLKYFKRT